MCVEEISHKRIVHKNGSVYATHIYSLNGHFKSVYATHIYSLNGHLTRKSVYATHIYSLNGHLTRKSVYAKSPLQGEFEEKIEKNVKVVLEPDLNFPMVHWS